MKPEINRREFIKAAGIGAASLVIQGCSGNEQANKGDGTIKTALGGNSSLTSE